MAIGGTSFNPGSVMMQNPGGTGAPYLWSGGPKPIKPVGPAKGYNPSAPQGINPVKAVGPAQGPGPFPASPQGTLGSESIRATGNGPFDPTYRQNLATYAGSQFGRPGGSLSFDPTNISTFPGQPTGGGTAPVTGMPTSLLDQALGGQPFSWAPPAPQNQGSLQQPMTLQYWMNQFLQRGNQPRTRYGNVS